ncbi:Methyltransferase-like protein 7A [Chionoecetes opilio]|uniref:Methyltransferase-like protein 7A n=1 Tax=Chionoecetes opilio TaxID=41210 RepID=A0A8J5CQW4_CHIOP|nr:Methyltransferase-like protein 7A [Chionoecetes opilio]
MLEWSKLPDTAAVREGVLEVWVQLQEYVQARPRQACVGLGVAAGGLLLWKFGPSLRHRYFAWINCKFSDIKSEDYEAFKRTVFASLKDMTSQDPKLQEEKTLRILEIGAGVGTNFNMYPDHTRLIVADPNPYFEKYFIKNKSKFPNIKTETIIVAKGEDIDMVKSSSVDVVVTTLVLCSVTDVAKVVSQVKRVLVPGGKYIFVEHVYDWARKGQAIRKFLQNILTYTGLWPFVFDGCHLNRNPLPVIEAVGFSDVSVEQQYAPMPAAFMLVAAPHLKGVATK